jgi:hypothetical protein
MRRLDRSRPSTSQRVDGTVRRRTCWRRRNGRVWWRGGCRGFAGGDCGTSFGERGAYRTPGRTGTSSRPEQFQQRQAAEQRWSEEAAAGQQLTGHQANGATGRKAILARRLFGLRNPMPSSIIIQRPAPVRRDVERGDGDGSHRTAGLRSAETEAAHCHRASRAWLPLRGCGLQNRGAFPEGVIAPVQYGQRLSAFVLYLLHYQLLPESKRCVSPTWRRRVRLC